MTNDDRLANEVAVSAKFDDSGIVASAKSRAIAAFDRLLGSALDIPTAHLEQIAEKARLRGELERLKLVQAAKAQSLDGDAYLIAKASEDIARKLENLSKIVNHSADIINEASKDVFQDGDLDEDWINRFRAYSQDVSSDMMQSLWGKVLAGEILHPSSFSVATLRFLSEVDRPVAETFQANTNAVLSGEFIPKALNLKGKLLLNLGALEDAGLVRDVNGSVAIDLTPNSDGKIFLKEDRLILIAESEVQQRIPVIPLTRIGRDMLRILPKPDPKASLESAFKSFDSVSVTSAKIVFIVEEFPDGRVHCSDVALLKARS